MFRELCHTSANGSVSRPRSIQARSCQPTDLTTAVAQAEAMISAQTPALTLSPSEFAHYAPATIGLEIPDSPTSNRLLSSNDPGLGYFLNIDEAYQSQESFSSW